jgi:hypothetical protein
MEAIRIGGLSCAAARLAPSKLLSFTSNIDARHEGLGPYLPGQGSICWWPRRSSRTEMRPSRQRLPTTRSAAPRPAAEGLARQTFHAITNMRLQPCSALVRCTCRPVERWRGGAPHDCQACVCAGCPCAAAPGARSSAVSRLAGGMPEPSSATHNFCACSSTTGAKASSGAFTRRLGGRCGARCGCLEDRPSQVVFDEQQAHGRRFSPAQAQPRLKIT